MGAFALLAARAGLLGRQLRRSPGFALTAVVTMALAVGVNVIAYGVLDALLVRGLPVPRAQELSFVQHARATEVTLSFPQYGDLRARNRSFAEMGAYSLSPVALGLHGHTEQRWATLATGSYFDVLGIRPYLGRFPTAADDRAGVRGNAYAVLSYDTWQQDFNSNPRIAGQAVLLSKHLFTVLGVAPPGFYGTERFVQPALWASLWHAPELGGSEIDSRASQSIWVIGRRKPGVSTAEAAADLNRIGEQLGREYPETDAKAKFALAEPGYVGNYFGPALREFLTGVMGLAALVLLAACANLGGLYAARAADRRREIAIRMALGSTKRRVAAGLLAESLLLALVGGALGCAVAQAALHALTNYRPPFDFPIAVAVDPGGRVYAFAAAASLIAGLLCGLVPAREAWRSDLHGVIKGGAGAPGRRWTLRDGLLVLEVALCCVLVTASSVAVRGLVLAAHAPLGFEPRGVTLATYDLDIAGYSGEDGLRFSRSVMEAARQIPGVRSVALSGNTPLDPVGGNTMQVFPAGTTEMRSENAAFNATTFAVSPGYFQTARTPLIAGRELRWTDDAKAPEVAVVNQTFARKLFGKQEAVGRTFVDRNRRVVTVVGVAADGKYGSLEEGPTPVMFRSMAHAPGLLTLLVRRGDGAAPEDARIANAVTQIFRREDAAVPVSRVQSWDAALAPVLFPARAATAALGTMGVLALALAVTGIFGLAAYTVAQRLRELGIRVALGARRRDVVESALGRVGRIVAWGSVAGLLAGLAGSRLLRSIVYGASATDPLVLLAVAVTMLGVGCLATALPAKRALAVDPAALLREE